MLNRRQFLTRTALASLAVPAAGLFANDAAAAPPSMRLGLVTYNWGKDWDLPTLLDNCQKTGMQGVELRSTHKHGVEPSLNREQRSEVRKRFADSPVALAGLGSACEYHSPDPEVVRRNIEETKAFIVLCHDLGGGGVKVRPNGLPQGVPEEKTLTQIGESLQEVAQFAAEHGVEVRLEVHGRGTDELFRIRKIMEVADHPAAVVCWNCNPTDLKGNGLEENFRMVADRIGTVHIHDLRRDNYPWKQLFSLLKETGFRGWTLIEDGRQPDDVLAALRENREIWQRLVSEA